MDILGGQLAGGMQWRRMLFVALIHVCLVMALLYGLASDGPIVPAETRIAVEAIAVPPPPLVEHHRMRRSHSAPATVHVAPHVEASPVVAPLPALPPPPSQVVSAQVAGQGLAPEAAAAAAGTGDGVGQGNGGGDGDGVTPSRQIAGHISADDYPRSLYRAGVQGRLSTRYTVGVDGRVTDCVVTRSSGVAELDALTCRLIRERYRYEPALDRQGRPVPDVWEKDHIWALRDGEPR